MRGRKRPEHRADRKAGEQDILAFLDAVGIAQLAAAASRRRRSSSSARSEPGSTATCFASRKRHLARRPGRESGRRASRVRGIERARQHVRIGHDQRAVADRESRAAELELRRARALERADRDDRAP